MGKEEHDREQEPDAEATVLSAREAMSLISPPPEIPDAEASEDAEERESESSQT